MLSHCSPSLPLACTVKGNKAHNKCCTVVDVDETSKHWSHRLESWVPRTANCKLRVKSGKPRAERAEWSCFSWEGGLLCCGMNGMEWWGGSLKRTHYPRHCHDLCSAAWRMQRLRRLTDWLSDCLTRLASQLTNTPHNATPQPTLSTALCKASNGSLSTRGSLFFRACSFTCLSCRSLTRTVFQQLKAAQKFWIAVPIQLRIGNIYRE